MSNTNYTRWWRDGTIAVTKNSKAVTGMSTYWASANIDPGDIMKINGVDYEVQSVTDDTHLTLATPYTGEAGSGLGYAIVRNFTSTPQSKVAAQTSELMYDFSHFIDTEHSTITGKSAYEVAKDNGYVGTEAQWLESLTAYGVAKKGGYTGTVSEWLESLKAAGEWSNANSRITNLEGMKDYYPECYVTDPIYKHNLHPRFKNLGTTITSAQYAAINNASFDDLYVGDYWNLSLEIDGVTKDYTAMIVEVGVRQLSSYANKKGLHMMLHMPNSKVPFHSELTDDGVAYKNCSLRTEFIPKVVTALESCLGESHILSHTAYIDDTTTVEADGTEHETGVDSKMELFHLGELSYYHGAKMTGAAFPYALFRNMLPWNFDFATMIQETTGNNIYIFHPRTDIGGNLLTRKQNTTWSTHMHCILVP